MASSDGSTSDDVTYNSILVYVAAAAAGLCVVTILLLAGIRLYVQRVRSRRRDKCPVTYCSSTLNGHHLFPLAVDNQWELNPAKLE